MNNQRLEDEEACEDAPLLMDKEKVFHANLGMTSSRHKKSTNQQEEDPVMVGDDLTKKASMYSDFSKVQESTWSVRMRHSRGYVAWTFVQVILVTAMVIWIAVDHSAVRNGFFLFLEFVVTASIVFDTVLQIHFQGVNKFFCNQVGDEQIDVTGRTSVAAQQKGFCATYGFIFVNYGELALAAFSVFGLIAAATARVANWEEDLTLSLLLIRYVFLIVFFAWNHHRNVTLNGGLFKVFGKEEEVDETWDVKF